MSWQVTRNLSTAPYYEENWLWKKSENNFNLLQQNMKLYQITYSGWTIVA